METVFVGKIREIRKLRIDLEKKLNVKIKILGNKITVVGAPLNEYDAVKVFDAVHFGFSVRKALLLKQEDFVFRKIHIKDYTKRNLRDVKARLIGKYGKTRKIISEISGCEILVNDSEVGIIGYVENVEDASVAIISLIKGSKQTNMYKYLEKMNKTHKIDMDLGIKDF